MSEFKAPTGADEAGRALNEALAKAQGAFGPVTKSARVETPRFSYSYAPLDAILTACRPALTDNGLSIVQLLESNGQGPSLRTELRHSGGATIGASFPFIAPESPQALGSLLTYLRRYAITALLGIAAEEDDDGQAAAGAKSAKEKARPKMIDEAQRGQIDTALQALIEGAPQREGQLSWPAMLREKFEVQSKEELTHDQAILVIAWLQGKLENAGVPF